ncbi:hypothetical protein T492DRAFT_898294 [Pavlovales sp. CCMP2436]|nr:hypothetical protein T492DRAFT_898294 [Pavlovales sp. CCMP2436]
MGWSARSGRWSGWRAGRRAWATRRPCARASRARCAAAPRPRAAPITLHRASCPSRALSCATPRRQRRAPRCAKTPLSCAAPSRQRRAGCVDQAAPRPRAAPSTLRCA